jgi:hypothetical protein
MIVPMKFRSQSVRVNECACVGVRFSAPHPRLQSNMAQLSILHAKVYKDSQDRHGLPAVVNRTSCRCTAANGSCS